MNLGRIQVMMSSIVDEPEKPQQIIPKWQIGECFPDMGGRSDMK